MRVHDLRETLAEPHQNANPANALMRRGGEGCMRGVEGRLD